MGALMHRWPKTSSLVPRVAGQQPVLFRRRLLAFTLQSAARCAGPVPASARGRALYPTANGVDGCHHQVRRANDTAARRCSYLSSACTVMSVA